jgi:hypothetical protein
MIRRIVLLAGAALLAGCAAAPTGPGAAPAPASRAGDPATCVALFQEFDRLEQLYGSAQPRRDGRIAPAPIVSQGDRLRRAGCITRNAQLAGAAALPVTPWSESGAPIAPIALHVGVVQSNAEDDRIRALFEARGIRARSVGSPVLGRRIYLGPFATEGGIASAADLARSFGFVAPYPARF